MADNLTAAKLEETFPALAQTGYTATSNASRRYNCIAWVAEDEHRWWWPDRGGIGFWPPDVQRELTVTAFAQAFATLGYSPCETSDWEPAFEKIAIYLAEGRPTHAARQLPDGSWTSKCGRLEDIRHTLAGLAGDVYGQPAIFLARARK